jgi:peptidyl-dipeptidase Dcp
MNDQTATTDNPLLEDWTGPFGVPPFSRITPEHFTPAFDRAFAQHDAEIAGIAGDAAAPTFVNTIEALERAGRTLDRVGKLFGVLAAAHTNDALLAIERHPAQRAAVPPHRRALAAS